MNITWFQNWYNWSNYWYKIVKSYCMLIFDPFWLKYLMFYWFFRIFNYFFKSMRFSKKVWEVWDSGKKYDLLPKVWDVEGLKKHLKEIPNKSNRGVQTFLCAFYIFFLQICLFCFCTFLFLYFLIWLDSAYEIPCKIWSL